MITLVRTAQAIPGKLLDVIPWAKEVAAISKRVGGREVSFHTAFGGNVNDMAWIVQYDNAAQLEEARAKLLANQEYVSRVNKGAEMLVTGSVRDQLWMSV